MFVIDHLPFGDFSPNDVFLIVTAVPAEPPLISVSNNCNLNFSKTKNVGECSLYLKL